MKTLKNSQYRLRKAVGILGIALPIVILVVNQKLLSSISHYYYTSASIFFIGILFTFGLVLISYKGYEAEMDEKIGDDWLTTLAGIAILVTVLLPTACTGSGEDLLFCGDGYLFGHSNHTIGAIHLISAAIFLFILGWMCVKQFTKSKNPESKLKNKVYKNCGYIVWVCIGLLVLIFAYEKIAGKDFNDTVNGYTFILESISVWAFSTAWLIKGKIDADWKDLRGKFLKK